MATVIKERALNVIAIAAVAGVIIWLALIAPSPGLIADDTAFASALKDTSFLEYLGFRYFHWSGRLPIDAALPFIVDKTIAWKTLNAGFLLLLCHSLASLAIQGSRRPILPWVALSAAGLLLFSKSVLLDAVLWRTGSINYLWPSALGAFGLLGLVGSSGGWLRILQITAACLSMYNEQVALVLLPAAGMLVLNRAIERGRPATLDVAQWMLMLANATVLFLAPGNANRYLVEAKVRFPDFPTLSALDRLSLGAHRALEGMLDASGYTTTLLAVLVAASLPASRLAKDCKLLIGAACFLVVLGPMLSASGQGAGVLKHYFLLPQFDGMAAMSSHAYALHALWTIVFATLFIGASLTWPIKNLKESAFTLACLGLGFGSVVALGFSPSVHESGPRVFFIAQVVLLATILRRLVLLRKASADGNARPV